MISNCKNCGAPLDWTLLKCEYCGTQYQKALIKKTPAAAGMSLPEFYAKNLEAQIILAGLNRMEAKEEAQRSGSLSSFTYGLTYGLIAGAAGLFRP